MPQLEDRKNRFLVTGANGFVGKALCDTLDKSGYDVRGAVRQRDEIQYSKIPLVAVGEINEQTDWTAALSGIDVVVHLAARVHVMHESSKDPLADFRRTNVLGTEQLARAAAAAGVRRLVYVSSIKVNGEETHAGEKFKELDTPAPQDPYGISKWESEQALHRIAEETGLEVVIVRPPLVYGARVKGNFIQMLKFLSRNIPLPLASVCNLRSLIYIGNFVDVLLCCAIHPAAVGKTYLVSDGEDVSTSDLLRQLGSAMGSPVRLFSFPLALLRFAARMLKKSEQLGRLLGSLRIDNSKICQELDWHPPFTLHQGLKATADWYMANKP